MIGEFNIPLDGREMIYQLSNGVPVQIRETFLFKALILSKMCAEAELDVRTDKGEAYLTPRKFELNDAGKAFVAKPASAGEG